MKKKKVQIRIEISEKIVHRARNHSYTFACGVSLNTYAKTSIDKSHQAKSRTLSVDASSFSFSLSFFRSRWHSIFGYEKFDRDLTQQQQQKSKNKNEKRHDIAIHFIRLLTMTMYACIGIRIEMLKHQQLSLRLEQVTHRAVFYWRTFYLKCHTCVYLSEIFSIRCASIKLFHHDFMRINAQFSMFANQSVVNAHKNDNDKQKARRAIL